MNTKYLTEDNFEDLIKNSKTPVIIDFYADWCGPCQMMAPVFDSLSEEYRGKVSFVKLNTDEEPELASKFSVRGIPTLVVMKNNKEVDRLVGFAPKPVLKSKIDSLIK